MTILTSGPNPGIADIVLSEGDESYSRDNVVVTQSGAAVQSGTLLTQIGDAGAAAAVAAAGNTGNPTFGAITVGAAAIPGAYDVTFTAATKFDVEDPLGVKIGSGTTGVAFSKAGMGFTLTAGGTPAIAGDGFAINVAAGNGKYIPYVAAGASGPADAILVTPLPAATGDVKALAITRMAEVNGTALVGLDATAKVQLAAKGIVVRSSTGLAGSY